MFPKVFWCQNRRCGRVLDYTRSDSLPHGKCRDCGGDLAQMRFVKIHRCGTLKPLSPHFCQRCKSSNNMALDTRGSERVQNFGNYIPDSPNTARRQLVKYRPRDERRVGMAKKHKGDGTENGEKPNEDKSKSEYENFQSLLEQVLAVPKEDVDKRRREEQQLGVTQLKPVSRAARPGTFSPPRAL